ncbi:hypothetical protein BEWA_001150 [Theileria equi strain WA]|uniref:Uncharacterized protein n=1 Tax=Theileria equi strain WA TaxID=1537102 RepID=L0AZL7_THEEQ|nr:hypothetical protein BEWA_001150 [Theileria equi strain WA]AFZ80708.1 hypothetical protein BEWA_001150 [Theileria equi strain WA]|eukprot:XP_004830374.1 hypothetical protein BEWA_001150 [Theileria equi strain WA]
MWVSSSKLRMAIAKSKKAKEKGEDENEDFRKGIHDTHKYVFMFIAYCMAPISGVTLLLESVFHCENIANKCYLSYIITGSISTITSLMCLKMSFTALVIYFWLLMPILVLFVPVIYFGNGQTAKTIFIILCGVAGILEAPILSKHISDIKAIPKLCSLNSIFRLPIWVDLHGTVPANHGAYYRHQ